MNQNWLIISYEPLASSLERYLRVLFHRPVDTLILPRRFFDEDLYHDVSEYEKYYYTIQTLLCCKAAEELRETIVVFTKWIELNANISEWNPLLLHSQEKKYPHPQEILLSWLVLSFPEVHWVFFDSNTEGNLKYLKKFQFIRPQNSKFIIDPYVPLFDPTGFRNGVRKCINQVLNNNQKQKENFVPIRPLKAAAIDEEPAYAFMHAYITYKFGYCSWAVTTMNVFKSIFKDESKEEKKYHRCELIFEDLYLNFADRPSSIEDILDDNQKKRIDERFERSQRRFSYLPFRDAIFPSLQNIKRRILVTIGHKKGGMDKIKWEENRIHLTSLRNSGQKNKILYKPFAGVYDLWKKAGLWKRSKNRPLLAGEKNPNVPETDKYHWPLGKRDPSEESGHSAPGRLLVIAQRLIDRAEKILKNAMTVPDAIHAAVLALEAKELLGNRTPTTSLEALALQHQAEITAESMFYGVEYNLNVKDRFKDIEREVKAISQWFNPKTRKRSEINARLAIVESLVQKFREMNQFEEEIMCLTEARKLRFEFWMRQKPWRRAAWPFLKYLELALYSLPLFLVIVFLWTVIFGIIYVSFKSGTNFFEAYGAAVRFFFTMEPAENFGDLPNIILASQGLISFVNLSLLISNLYLIISRR